MASATRPAGFRRTRPRRSRACRKPPPSPPHRTRTERSCAPARGGVGARQHAGQNRDHRKHAGRERQQQAEAEKGQHGRNEAATEHAGFGSPAPAAGAQVETPDVEMSAARLPLLGRAASSATVGRFLDQQRREIDRFRDRRIADRVFAAALIGDDDAALLRQQFRRNGRRCRSA